MSVCPRETEQAAPDTGSSPMSKVYREPSQVTASAGEVAVKGPDGVDLTLSPEAAVETSDRLIEAAAQARGLELQERLLGTPVAREMQKD